MSLIVSISGIRGIVGESLIPDIIVKYSAAFAEYCKQGTIVIGRDGRITGKIIGNLIASTLLSKGCDVIALGVVPTPTIQIAVEELKAAGGISITASHNPIEWNGMKFIGRDGTFLDADANIKLQQLLNEEGFGYAKWNRIGSHWKDDSFIKQHIQKVIELPYINLQKIRNRNFKVVVDCVNAAGSVIVPALLNEMGCQVITINCDSSGIFAHTPEPIPENITELCDRVKKENADLGIVVDPDVDRLVLVNEKGEPFGEEYTITSVIKYILSILPKDRLSPIVVNLSTTRSVDDVAKSYGIKVCRSPVGEINVVKKMKEVGAIIGGEGSGGVILPELHYGRDAIVGIALFLQYFTDYGGTLSQLKATLPQYNIIKDKITVEMKNLDDIFNNLTDSKIHGGIINTEDGLKIDFSDSWVHFRKSNTEPIIRVIAEAITIEKAREMVNYYKSYIKNI